jgi:glycerophosphoryl diester phosphodiesterase
VKLIGHKGADAIAPGNTIPSFEAAVEAGVQIIELDVLRPRSDYSDGSDWRQSSAGPANRPGEPLLVAHDWADAARREPLTLAEVLGAFTRPPLESVEIDLDLKLAGREDEIVAALRDRDLVARSMVSTMERSSLLEVGRLEPALRRGWTFPKVTRDWTGKRWATPLVLGATVTMRRRLPRLAARELPLLGVELMWVYHPLITRRLVTAVHGVGRELIAWTVDDACRMRDLAAMGVDGICTNDPRLFSQL